VICAAILASLSLGFIAVASCSNALVYPSQPEIAAIGDAYEYSSGHLSALTGPQIDAINEALIYTGNAPLGHIEQMHAVALNDTGAFAPLGGEILRPFLLNRRETAAEYLAANGTEINITDFGELVAGVPTNDGRMVIGVINNVAVSPQVGQLVLSDKTLLTDLNLKMINMDTELTVTESGETTVIPAGMHLFRSGAIITLTESRCPISVFRPGTINQITIADALADAPETHAPETDAVVDAVPCGATCEHLDMPERRRLQHFRLGHAHDGNLTLTLASTTGLDSAKLKQLCGPCVLGKMRKHSFSPSDHRAQEPLELVHVDVFGPFSIDDLGLGDDMDRFHAIVFVDDYSRFGWVYKLEAKSDCIEALERDLDEVGIFKLGNVRQFRCDNAPELNSQAWGDRCRDFGVAPNQTTTPYAPSQNGVAEKYGGDITRAARTMLINANLSGRQAFAALRHAVYVRNRTARPMTNNITPYELMHNRPPDLSDLRIFGCDAYVLDLGVYHYKLDPSATAGILVGYGDDGHCIGVPRGRTRFTKGAIVELQPSRKLIITTHVRFDEASVFPPYGREPAAVEPLPPVPPPSNPTPLPAPLPPARLTRAQCAGPLRGGGQASATSPTSAAEAVTRRTASSRSPATAATAAETTRAADGRDKIDKPSSKTRSRMTPQVLIMSLLALACDRAHRRSRG
jgi:hypothetical protein